MVEKKKSLPISCVIPTAGRRSRLIKTLSSILEQRFLPSEIIVVDGSLDCQCSASLEEKVDFRGVSLIVEEAEIRGAGAQRNQGIRRSAHSFIWFLDDDVDLESGCLETLWGVLRSDEGIGACGCVITNQTYSPPGNLMRKLLRFAGCPRTGTLAGKCEGVAVTFLPSSDFDGEGQIVDWLNTTCTLYRKGALPTPPFLPFFQGYSFMEDAALSIQVGKNWGLRVTGNAKIFHDSVPMNYKSRIVSRQRMETVNRWFIATKLMGQDSRISLFRLIALQGIGILALVRAPNIWWKIPLVCAGNALGILEIAARGRKWQGYAGFSAST